MLGILGGYYAGYTLLGTMLGIHSWVYIPGIHSWVHRSASRSCTRPHHRWPCSRLTALEHRVVELTVRHAALTVVPVTDTRFTVGQAVVTTRRTVPTMGPQAGRCAPCWSPRWG